MNRNTFLSIFLTIISLLKVLAIPKLILTSEGDYEGSKATKEVVDRILKNSPIIDTHNDLPWNFRVLLNNEISKIDISTDLTAHPFWYKIFNSSSEGGTHTDIPRMKASGYGGQFWSVYTKCASQMKDSVEQTLESIDLVKRLCKKYPQYFHWATSTADIDEAIKRGKIASLIGIEGGHAIQASYAILRMYYELGARYLTLTHTCNNPWADNSHTDNPDKQDPDYSMPQHGGITPWGLGVVDEMNRLGMMVDLSHTSENVMRQVLKRSKAPIIFSHSGAKAIFNHHRNVPDDVLALVKTTNSIVNLNIFSGYLTKDKNSATIEHAVAHANHIKKFAGVDNIGIGCDYDGVPIMPKGLEHVGKLRNLIEALYDTGNWTEEDLEKLTSRNIRRVLAKVEQVRDFLITESPKEDPFPIPPYWNQPSLTQKFF